MGDVYTYVFISYERFINTYIHVKACRFSITEAMNVLCPGKRPYYKRVALPVTTYVDSKKVVIGYNLLFLLTWILSIIYFVFYTKGWSEPIPITASSSMWLDPSSHLFPNNKYELPYCDNADYNYYHYGRWDYRNISCKTMTEENIFSKGISPGSYWISTLFVDEDYNYIDDTKVNNSIKMYYPKYPEYMLLGLRLTARAKAIKYVSILSYTPIYIEMAEELSDKRIKNVYKMLGLEYIPKGPNKNTSLIEVTNFKNCKGDLCWGDANPNELRIQFKVSEWLAMAGVNLDSYNNSLFHKKGTSVGNAYTRTTGVGIYMNYEFRNIPVRNSALSFVTYQLSCVIRIRTDMSWQRITMGKGPTNDPDKYRRTDVYGIRFVLKLLDQASSNSLLAFSLQSLVTSIFDVVIFFSMMRMFTTIVLFNLYGKKSKKWRKAAKRHIKHHVKQHEKEKIAEKIPVDNAETVINTAELDKSVSERKKKLKKYKDENLKMTTNPLHDAKFIPVRRLSVGRGSEIE